MTTNNPVAQIFASVIAQMDTEKKLRDDRIAEFEAQGYRIIDGGEGFPDGGTGWIDMPYTDWRTAEVVPNNDGDKNVHIEGIEEDAFWASRGPIDPCGLPSDLIPSIEEWVWENEEEARAWLKGLAA